MSQQDRKRSRRLCIVATVALLLLLVSVVAITLGVTLGRKKSGQKSFRQTFIARCKLFKGDDCESLFSTFERAYVGRDPRHVGPEAYDPLFELAPITTSCNKAMFWSKTKDLVHNYIDRNTACFVTMENTLLGSVLDDLTWCGEVGSNETVTHGCPEWNEPKTNPRQSFWEKGSASFAEAACGNATVMLSGSTESPFDPSSIFGSVEVPGLNPPKVKKLTVVLAMPTEPRSSCSSPSLEDLQQKLASGISYECKEVSQAQIEKCSSEKDTCTACW